MTSPCVQRYGSNDEDDATHGGEVGARCPASVCRECPGRRNVEGCMCDDHANPGGQSQDKHRGGWQNKALEHPQEERKGNTLFLGKQREREPADGEPVPAVEP